MTEPLSSTGRGWQSWHLHDLPSGEGIEAMLLEQVGPLVRALQREGLIAGWFFIRFWEGGPHLRLRLRVQRQGDARRLAQIVEGALTPTLHRFPDEAAAARYLERIAQVADASLSTDPTLDPSIAATVRNPGLYSADYVPEVRRYGSGRALERSEEVFALSSQAVLDIVESHPSPVVRQLSFIELLAKTANQSQPGNVHGLLETYRQHWERWSNLTDPAVFPTEATVAWGKAFASRLSSTGGVRWTALVERTSHLDELSRAIASLTGDYPDWGNSLPISHLHMFCNRLGLLVHQEAALISCAEVLEQPGE